MIMFNRMFSLGELQVFVKRVSNVKTFEQQFDEYAYLEMTIQNYCSVRKKGSQDFISSYDIMYEKQILRKENPLLHFMV